MANIGTLTASLGIDTSGLKKAKGEVRTFTGQAEKQMGKVSGAAMIASRAFIAAAAAATAWKVAQIGMNAVLQAARYKTLGVVMEVVGRNTGVAAKEMHQYASGLEDAGIAMIESRVILTRMAQAQIDLSKSSDLARIAQDAAVIGNTNSSEAFEKLIHGIQSAQIEVLRTVGINVNFEQSYKKLAKQLGKNSNELTEQEKVQARVNVVMEAGARIAGTYEAAMGTAGKKLNSMKRHFDNLMVTLGAGTDEGFADLIDLGTEAIKDFAKYMGDPEVQQSIKSTASGIATLVGWMIELNKIRWKLAKFKPVNLAAELSKSIMGLAGGSETVDVDATANISTALAAKAAAEEAKKIAEVQAAARQKEQLSAITSMKERSTLVRKELTTRLDDWQSYYDDLGTQMQEHADAEKANFQELNDLFTQQISLRRSTEEMLAGLGAAPERSREEEFKLSRSELEQQFENTKLLGGQEQIAALEEYKRAVADLAEEFKDGVKYTSGAKITEQAINDVKTAYELQKGIMEDLTAKTEEQIRVDEIWGETLKASAIEAEDEIIRLQDLIAQLDEQIATMDATITVDTWDLASSTLMQIQQEIAAIQDKTITITANYVSSGAGGALPVLDSFATGTNFVPETGLYELHKGEAVVPASQNIDKSSNTKFGDINITLPPGSNPETVDWRSIVRDQIIPEIEEMKRG